MPDDFEIFGEKEERVILKEVRDALTLLKQLRGTRAAMLGIDHIGTFKKIQDLLTAACKHDERVVRNLEQFARVALSHAPEQFTKEENRLISSQITFKGRLERISRYIIGTAISSLERTGWANIICVVDAIDELSILNYLMTQVYVLQRRFAARLRSS